MTKNSSGLVCKRNSWLSYWKIICKLRGNFDGRLKCSKHGIWLDRNEAKWPKRIKFPTRNIHALIFNSHSKVFIFTRFLISLSEFKHGWAWKAEELCESETNGANCNENRWTISFLPPFDYRSLSHLLSEHEWEEYGWVKEDYFSMSCIFNVSMKKETLEGEQIFNELFDFKLKLF